MNGPDPGLDLLLDPGRLAALTGRPDLRVRRVRPKPGDASAAALMEPAADASSEPGRERPWGWVQSLTGNSGVKLEKIRLRADQAPARLAQGFGFTTDAVPGSIIAWGPLATDTRLAAELHRAIRKERLDPDLLMHTAPHGGPHGGVLRYNPLRRLVIRQADQVLRITAEDHRGRLTGVTQQLAAQGCPVVVPLPAASPRERISYWPWVPGSDAGAVALAGGLGPERAADIGRVLGQVHSLPIEQWSVESSSGEPGSGDAPVLPRRGWSGLRAAAQASITQLVRLGVMPQEMEVARGLLATLPHTLPEGPPVVSHGDFSLDQCLITPTGQVLLTDFDRACLAPAELDLATLTAVAVMEEQPGAVVDLVYDSYLASRKISAMPAALGAWVAVVLLSRIAEPWRSQHPDHIAQTARRIAAARAYLQSAGGH